MDPASPHEPQDMEGYYSLLQAGSELESTLQQVTVPVSMKEVAGYIEKQVAYLSGGRGAESSVIITLPECSDFSDIPEEVLAKVLTYLTLIPRARQPGVKFIIILDRRLDTWTSIKTALARIAASFPGNLHLVLVLRPTSFFQRTVTDLGFRFSQDDFMLKMPVVMLSSVTDLLRYISENQLTTEFGGTLDYCHSDWIVLRTAIESFAVMVKDIAQMLQAFGTELAETQLPEKNSAVELLLLAHTEKYRRLKDAINSVMREGRHLLSSLEASGKEEDQHVHWDITQDWDTVQRLIAQLRDMEMAFDGFFDKHHLKLQQYLQLLRYERSFHEATSALEKLASLERKVVATGDTLGLIGQASRELDVLEDRALEELGRAQVMILQGHQLAAGHHYASALVVQRCNELRYHCDTLTSAIRAKRKTLAQMQTLLQLLEEAQQWCDEGTYLLANQLVDKLHSKEVAQAALRDIQKFQEGAPVLLSAGPDELIVEYESVLTSHLQTHIEKTFEKHGSVQKLIQARQSCLKKLADKHKRPVRTVAPRADHPPPAKSPVFSPRHGKRASRKSLTSRKIEVMHEYQNHSSLFSAVDGEDSAELLKRRVMKELIETERTYVEELLAVLLGYRAEMDNPSLSPLLPISLRNKRDILFGNMPDIYNFHSRVFLQDLESCLDTPEAVGARFLARKENFQVYECYCQNKPRSESLWGQFSDCAFFQECQRRLEHKLALDSYLLKPVQRLTKYQLLLKELLKYSSGCERVSELQGALSAMLDLLKSVNDSMHQIAITGYEGDLSELGRVLMQGSFSVSISHKRGTTRVKELARFKPMQRHLFLHEHALLFCKRREEHGEHADKTPSYSFKHCLKMSAVGITENVKGDVKKFEIWYSGREEVYVVQAPTVEVKRAWLNEIRKVLTNQQKLLKEELRQSSSLADQMQLSPPLTLSESKLQRASVSSEGTESACGSPDRCRRSPRHRRNRRSWPGAPHSVDICKGLEDWNRANRFSYLSDTEGEIAAHLAPGRYKASADYLTHEPDDLIIKGGDVIQLQLENDGRWLVQNLSRKQEGRIPAARLQVILGDGSRGRSSQQGEPVSQKTRKLSSP
ncbi:proto-oncogene DBL isoform X2 [Electrophorus electricus]|uniref:proto-oncogene DBL isoform X2 n=1 Tax=Electrophorus electricus TaxID=8005 RepID=UPI0015D00C1A|nr:proto-oncogene DBL isoform X2 [Electrophorus electricus]